MGVCVCVCVCVCVFSVCVCVCVCVLSMCVCLVCVCVSLLTVQLPAAPDVFVCGAAGLGERGLPGGRGLPRGRGPGQAPLQGQQGEQEEAGLGGEHTQEAAEAAQEAPLPLDTVPSTQTQTLSSPLSWVQVTSLWQPIPQG